ncbi:uncharacterized protein LOC110831893 isoform X2 [Zootermopsis nevadensis]|uniref:Uncharacterized protein n=2 Tax=Zootermopsis nevadensis TaxID=136037 RepID=A0A067R2Y7_ZOONE|nr:uncharacterized protein LOC110831893 isoform X2 [Zootermopsis nevadensis]XP_021924059.1 uncharacterized protein LOC110831893 isoform X2 [Zootermopsis nevadensis]KDR17279.1 hypothetical protein L798_08845 [Zootermopsis nevadensis]
MEEFEEFLDQIHCQVSASGIHMDRHSLKDCLLEPGEERLELIHWALSALGIEIKERDITEVVVECGLCLPSNLDIVLGKCSAEDNFEFWKRLFHIVRMYQEAKPTSVSTYKNINKFWLELAANPDLKDVLQPKRRKGILPLKVPKDSAKNMSVEKLLKKKVLEESKLRDLEKDKEACLPSEDTEEFCNTGIQDTEDLDKLKHQVDIFRNDMATFLMPWILDTPKNLELDEYDSLIPELANKVDKVKGICEDARKILAALEVLSKIKLEKPSTDEKLSLPYIQKEDQF